MTQEVADVIAERKKEEKQRPVPQLIPLRDSPPHVVLLGLFVFFLFVMYRWPLFAVLSSFLISHSESGAVGLCTTECLEQNRFKIVRVHLRDDLVMAGVCRNMTQAVDGVLSAVFPFVCDRNIGIWNIDQDVSPVDYEGKVQDEEGVVPFRINCPANDPVPESALLACPKNQTVA